MRVNRFALSLLHVWRRPLPEVLKELVMDPINASNTWQWHGYRNSWVTIDGLRMQSVSGGGYWGGGMWITAHDLARLGYLTLRRGRWQDRQILSKHWIDMATTPTAVQPTYGFMNYFLNTHRELLPSVPATHYYHSGMGANRVWVHPSSIWSSCCVGSLRSISTALPSVCWGRSNRKRPADHGRPRSL